MKALNKIYQDCYIYGVTNESDSKTAVSSVTVTSSDVDGSAKPKDVMYETFYRVIGEVDDYAIFLLDLDGTIMSWNTGAQSIKGYTLQEIIGRNFRLFYSAEDLNKDIPGKLLELANAVGKASHEGWRIRKDGSRFWGSVSITAVHSTPEQISGYLKVTRDLTQKKIADDKLENYIEQLRAKNDALQQSEERYHKMVAEVSGYAIILLDKEGKIAEWNQGAVKLSGYTSDEIVGKKIRLFYPIEDKQAEMPEVLLETATKCGFVSHEGYQLRKDGSRFWANISITALHGSRGEIIGFSKVTKDLSERKKDEDKLSVYAQELFRANEALRQSEERYHKMIAEVQDYAILLLDREGIIQNWNVGAEYIKGYNASEIVGKSFKTFYLQEDIKAGVPDQLLRDAELQGKATSEGWRLRKDGSKFWGSIVITALHNTKNEIIGFSKVTRDLTEKKYAEDVLRESAAELRVKNQALERLNSELSSFAYVVSHDLKEPLRKMQIFADRQLEEGKSVDDMRKYAVKIVNGAARMQKLMDALLSYSQLSAQIVETEDVDLNQILQGVTSDLELRISDSNAIITSEKLPVVRGVSYQLHQMFLNLIGNAIKFAKPLSRPDISIKCVSSHKLSSENPVSGVVPYYKITFADRGIGFDQSHVDKIFDVFQRLKSGVDAGGAGIGLAIVKRVVQNHNGFIEVESGPDCGANFHIYLPY